MFVRKKHNGISARSAHWLRLSVCALALVSFAGRACAEEAKEWTAPTDSVATTDTNHSDSNSNSSNAPQITTDQNATPPPFPNPPIAALGDATAVPPPALPQEVPNLLPEGDGPVMAKSAEEIEKETRRKAFDTAIQGILPLRPEEIRELLEHFDRTREAVEVPVYPAPRPEVAVETVSLDPGALPPVIKVAQGNVTTLSFLDVTGAPWPIQDISWAGNFEVVESGSEEGAHMVRISPQSEFATGNMSVRLLTLKTPVILTLDTSRDIVHYRFDAIIPDYGPMAEAPLIDRGLTIKAGSEDLSSVLRGVPPSAAVKLHVSGVDGRTSAYKLNGQTFVRTPLTLLSPTWSSSVSSADGMRVYAIQSAPVLLMSDRGKMVRAHLSDREVLSDE